MINVGNSIKQLTAVLLFSLTILLLQTQAQPLTFGENVADLIILEDNSMELRGIWNKPIRPWEIASYLTRGIPLSSDLVYVSNLSIERGESDDKLRGELTAVIYPRLNPREVRPDIIKEYQARNLLTKSRIVDLLAVLYGEDMLVYYGIETELRDVNITSVVHGNFTVTTLMINATVESSAEFIESLNLTFVARRVSETLYAITYSMNLTTSSIPPSKEEGYLIIDLTPIVKFFPSDTVTMLKVNLTHSSLQLVKSDPEATLLTPRHAEILFVPINKDTVILYLNEVSFSLFAWLSIVLSLVIVTIMVVTKFLKIKLPKSSFLK